jgi:hypothetical protein
MNSATIVQKLWNYCNVLRDDGMSYGDYVEQLTYLLFLKMAAITLPNSFDPRSGSGHLSLRPNPPSPGATAERLSPLRTAFFLQGTLRHSAADSLMPGPRIIPAVSRRMTPRRDNLVAEVLDRLQ